MARFALSNSAAASQCGTVFEQVPSPDAGTADGTLSQLAALSDGTAWALGSQLGEAVLLYFDGSAWTAQPLPAEVEGIAFTDSTSTPDGDVWLTRTRAFSVYEVDVIFLRTRDGVIDRIDHVFSPRAPIDIPGTSASDVWALTGAGDVIHFDGSDWMEMDVPSPFQFQRLYPRGVYAARPDDVWIVGYINYSQTLALHWDGSAWTEYPGPPSDAPFLDVAVLTPDDAWATPCSLSDIDVLFHWDGVAWSKITPLAPPMGRRSDGGALQRPAPAISGRRAPTTSSPTTTRWWRACRPRCRMFRNPASAPEYSSGPSCSHYSNEDSGRPRPCADRRRSKTHDRFATPGAAHPPGSLRVLKLADRELGSGLCGGHARSRRAPTQLLSADMPLDRSQRK